MKKYAIFVLEIFIYGDLCAPPIYYGDSSREITEKSDWIRECEAKFVGMRAEFYIISL